MNYLRKNKKFIIILLLLIMISTPILEVKAHKATFLRSVVDTVNYKYVLDVAEDNPGKGKEANHAEAKLGDFAGDDYNLISTVKDPLGPFIKYKHEGSKKIELKNGGDDTKLGTSPEAKIFTFPTTQESESVFSGKNDSKPEDSDRAFYIGKELSGSLNGLLSFVNGGKGYKNLDHLLLTSIYIRPNQSINVGNEKAYRVDNLPGPNNSKYSIVYTAKVDGNGNKVGIALKTTDNNKSTGYSLNNNGDITGNGGDLKNAESYSFIYAVPKGYVPMGDKQQPLIGSTVYEFAKKAQEEPGKHDTAWLSIHHLTAQANYAHKLGITFQTGKPEEQLNVFQRAIKGILIDFVYSLMNLAGLYDVETLIFNRGLDNSGSQLYANGLMSTEWWKVVVRYHMIFQGLAFVVLAGAVIKVLIQANYSTINPAVRMHLYKIFEKMFAVGVLLVGIIPLTLMMTGLNNALVDIFATQVDLSSTGRMMSHGGILAGVIVELAFFATAFYLNFIYIIRKITIALLIASAPFFIVTMAFSYEGKGLFELYIKELIANIFLQSFHAFAYAFIFNLQASGRGIEVFASMVALIPLTELFRSLIFQNAGAGSLQVGKGLGTMSRGMTKGAAGAAIGTAAHKGLDLAEGAVSTPDEKGFETSTGGGSGKHPNARNLDSNVSALGRAGDMLKQSGENQKSVSAEGKHDALSGSKVAAGVALGAMSGVGKGLAQGSEAISQFGDGNAIGAARTAGELGSSMGAGVGMTAGSAMGIGAGLIQDHKDQQIEDSVVDGTYDAPDINPIQSKEELPNGDTLLGLNGSKLNSMGIDNMYIEEDDKRNKSVTMEVDTAKMGYTTNSKGERVPTPQAQNIAKMMALQKIGTPESKKALNDIGIKNIESLGQGKYRIQTTPNYTSQAGINDVYKSQKTGNYSMVKAAGTGSNIATMPVITDTQFKQAVENSGKNVQEVDLNEFIGGKTGDGNVSEGTFNRSIDDIKGSLPKAPTFNEIDNPINDGFNK